MTVNNPQTENKKAKYQMIVGAVGAIISILGLLFSKKFSGNLRKAVIIISLIGLFVSGWTFFTGWENYAVVMLGSTVSEKGKSIEDIPVISVKDKETLKSNMIKANKKILWLPCAKGGAWWKQSAHVYTRWDLPSHDVQCPNGRYLIKYHG